MRHELRLLALGALLALAAAPGRAEAFCRTSACGASQGGAQCTPAQPGDCGPVLFWPSPCLGFSMQQDASKKVPLATAKQIVTDAFAAWMGVTCPQGGSPRLSIEALPEVTCRHVGYNDGTGNANAIIFRDDSWPYTEATSALALTTLSFGVQSGKIYDADMEINGTIQITTGDEAVQYDLASIVTHEAGHFLGLAHSNVEGSTMVASLDPGSTTLRTLEADDIAAICAAFPPGDPIAAGCDHAPRGGFRSECASQGASGASGAGGAGGSEGGPAVEGDDGDDSPGCGLQSAGVGRGGAGAALALLALGLSAARRRASRSAGA